MTGWVYAFRYGDGDHVKIGKTKDLNGRRRALQGAHHHPLVLVDSIQHADYAEGERYLHQLLAVRRVKGGGVGSREHFVVSDAELGERFEETRRYLDVELPRQRQLPKYAALEAGEDFISPTEEILAVKRRSGEVRRTLANLQAEKDRLDEEARAAWQQVIQRQQTDRQRLGRLIHELDVEKAELETTIKLAIGPAAGIEGVATWKSVRDRNRKFDPEALKADDPEIFSAYRTLFDAARFRKDHPARYQTYMRVTTHREFEWIEEINTGATNGSGARADQPERQSATIRFFGAARFGRRKQRG